MQVLKKNVYVVIVVLLDLKLVCVFQEPHAVFNGHTGWSVKKNQKR